MTIVRAIPILFVCAALAAPALATPVAAPVPSTDRLVLVDNHGGEKGKKKAKGQSAKKNADRSNKDGETRGAERSDQVQGMQDTGKGGAKRKQ